MKKTTIVFLLLALIAGLFISCSQEITVDADVHNKINDIDTFCINGKYFSTLQAAVDYFKDSKAIKAPGDNDNVIYLTRNASGPGADIVDIQDLVIDFAGFTYSFTNVTAIQGETGGKFGLSITEGSKVTLKGLEQIDLFDSTADLTMVYIEGSDTILTIEDAPKMVVEPTQYVFWAANGATLTVGSNNTTAPTTISGKIAATGGTTAESKPVVIFNDNTTIQASELKADAAVVIINSSEASTVDSFVAANNTQIVVSGSGNVTVTDNNSESTATYTIENTSSETNTKVDIPTTSGEERTVTPGQKVDGDTEPTVNPEPSVARIGGNLYKSLNEAVTRASSTSEDTIVLLKSITLSSTISIGKDVVLDLNENTITLSGFESVYYPFTVNNEASFTVENGSIVVAENDETVTGIFWIQEGEGSLSISDLTINGVFTNKYTVSPQCRAGVITSMESGTPKIVVDNCNISYVESNTSAGTDGTKTSFICIGEEGSVLTLNNSVINFVSSASEYRNLINDGDEGCVISIINCTITTNQPGFNLCKDTIYLENNTWGNPQGYDWLSTCLSLSDGATMTVNGGSYTGQSAIRIWSSGGTVIVYDGTFTAMPSTTKEEEKNVLYADGGNGKANEYPAVITVNGGSFYGKIATRGTQQQPATITINNGTFRNVYFDRINDDQYNTIVIYGGTFDADPSAYVAEGYYADDTEIEGKWIVKPASSLFDGGTGIEEDPFIIKDYDTFQNVSKLYNAGYYYYKVKDGVESIDCSNWTTVNLNGSIDGNNITINSLDKVLLNANVYADNVVISNFVINAHVTGGRTGAAVLDDSARETHLNNIVVHGYLEGSDRASAFVGWGCAGVDMSWYFDNCYSDATLVGNGVGGFIAHPWANSTDARYVYLNDSLFEGVMIASGNHCYINGNNTAGDPSKEGIYMNFNDSDLYSRFVSVCVARLEPNTHSVDYQYENAPNTPHKFNQWSASLETTTGTVGSYNYVKRTELAPINHKASDYSKGNTVSVEKNEKTKKAIAFLSIGPNDSEGYGNYVGTYVGPENLDVSSETITTTSEFICDVFINKEGTTSTGYNSDNTEFYVVDSRYGTTYGSATITIAQYDADGYLIQTDIWDLRK